MSSIVKYLNFDFWFYQIYRLFGYIYNLIIAGPQTISSTVTLVFSVIFLAGYLGALAYLLYMHEVIEAYALFLFLLAGLFALYLLQTMNVFMVLAFVFLALLIYSWFRMRAVRKKEADDFMASFVSAADPKTEQSKEWQDILDHVDSDNESEWKLALIEADKLLDDLLKKAGYAGDGVGEELKTAETQGGLKSLQDAWEAHKIRNRIAHEAGFVLTKREARRAVEMYKKVFEELGFL